MKTYHIVRSAVLIIGVKAESPEEAKKLSGERLDDFLSLSCDLEHIGLDGSSYSVTYEGDTIFGGVTG
jgi:hypothetical protein